MRSQLGFGCHWIVVILVLAAGAFVTPARAATPEEVQKAIENAQKFLLSQQKHNGTWEEVASPLANGDQGRISYTGRQWGGLTSICTYALLASGMNPQEKQIKPAIHFIEHANIESTYALGLGSQIFTLIPESKDTKPLLKRNVALLWYGMHRQGPHLGFYSYWTGTASGSPYPGAQALSPQNIGGPQPADWFDRSNSQYGVLGMWALEEAGGEVPPQYWAIVDAAWKKAQKSDGGWNYNEDREVSASMTAAGVATLYITQDYLLMTRDWGVCRGGVPNPNIAAGLAWMDKHITGVLNSNNYYTFYGIERIGVASGRKYFGTLDWYKLGADYLVKNQRGDGSWEGEHGVIPNTCFGLLFLSRGRAPVMMNKLQYDSPKAPKNMFEIWNERPRDAANIAKWAGRQIESYLNWQMVNLQVPPEDLHDAPILYISGSQELDFSDEHKAKLRAFCEQGGLILGNANCNNEAFVRSFKSLGTKLFPRYEFKQLATNDIIFTHEQYNAGKWRVKPRIYALSNGTRYLMILIPEGDASRAWQTRSDKNKEDLYQLGANIFLYATDSKHLRVKGDTYIVNADKEVKPARTIKLARLDLGYNADPEPYGWTRLANILHNKHKTDLDGYQTPVKPTSDKLKGYKLAHLTGTGKLQLSDADRQALKNFVESGGTLIIDAAGGDNQFADTVEQELRNMFGPAAKTIDSPLPPDSPLYKQADAPIKQVNYRNYARPILSGNMREPRIRGITIGKRIAVFYSREDLSTGLVGQPVDGIYGYDPKSATDLMTAMVLYAAGK